MSQNTSISWTDATWNPVRGCSRVSDGCLNCYAMGQAHRFSGPGKPYDGLTTIRSGKVDWTGVARLVPSALAEPLRWRKPQRVFVNSMSDLFHHSLTDEEIAAVFGVMAACPHLTFQVLTKRPDRMLAWFKWVGSGACVELFKYMALAGRIEEFFAPERIVPVAGFHGYLVTSKGRVLSEHGTAACPWCGKRTVGSARKRWCSKDCRSKGEYEERMGRWLPPPSEPRELKPMSGEQGHCRVMLYRDGKSERPLVHRLVLEAFDRAPGELDQGCHIDGDPSNNALWNLRWGDQRGNWQDSKRHGTRRRYHKLSEQQVVEIRERAARGETGEALSRHFPVTATQIRNIVAARQWSKEHTPEWPLSAVWLGVSAENQATADERIPLLLQCPAAVRFVSAEPLLEAVDFSRWIERRDHCDDCREYSTPQRDDVCPKCRSTRGLISTWGEDQSNEHIEGRRYENETLRDGPELHWIIVGGESGHGARPCAIEWIESIVMQCKRAGVAAFVKQMGAYVVSESRACDTEAEALEQFGFGSRWLWRASLQEDDPKGVKAVEHCGLNVREFPEVLT